MTSRERWSLRLQGILLAFGVVVIGVLVWLIWQIVLFVAALATYG